ncbi:hypothetical protein [uncultured Salinicola sp.]|uniref:hypothetical protein n=1 Tax=uncultured Salinicola sp. TaxID=1193542 RepID=UPI00260DD733|nr:hypothetical protein [uncultured Salinicola sp.]
MMTPVTPPGVGVPMTTPAPTPSETSAKTLASQNLFEHMAGQAGASPPGASPGELGSNLIDNLDGFVDRVNTFAQQAQVPDAQAPDRFAKVTTPALDAGDTPTAIGDDKMAKVVDSLSQVFDHSIETTMVVRGATQVSGSANTLLKGQ